MTYNRNSYSIPCLIKCSASIVGVTLAQGISEYWRVIAPRSIFIHMGLLLVLWFPPISQDHIGKLTDYAKSPNACVGWMGIQNIFLLCPQCSQDRLHIHHGPEDKTPSANLQLDHSTFLSRSIFLFRMEVLTPSLCPSWAASPFITSDEIWSVPRALSDAIINSSYLLHFSERPSVHKGLKNDPLCD